MPPLWFAWSRESGGKAAALQMTRGIRRAGDHGILVELDPGVSFEGLHGAAAVARAILGVRACILGHASLYLLFEAVEPFAERARRVSAALESPPPSSAHVGRTHRIAVSIAPECAPDLDRLLSAAAIDRTRFRDGLASLRLRARYLGFRAGFAYLEGLPSSWSLPRLARPRLKVPAGSFGIAGPMAAFYPSDSPGGWNLIGRSAEVFWDSEREPPNLIAPGDTIQPQPVDAPLQPPAARAAVDRGNSAFAEVLRSGQLGLIVGAGDISRYERGLPLSGPFDADAAAAANMAAGNAIDAAVLECALVGPQLMFLAPCTLSWYGARAELLVNEDEIRDPRRFNVSAGDVLTIGRLRGGMRGYLAVDRGILNPAHKYEMSPRLMRAGTKLLRSNAATIDAEPKQLGHGDAHVIRTAAGPHQTGDLALIEKQLWEVTPALDRTGIRFRPLESVVEQPGDLPSCGMQFGTVQWHPSGELVALGPDHPVTGGYLQPMTVFSTERWKLAQLAPGDRVRWLIEE